MTALYWSTEYNAATQIFRKVLLWSVLGVFISQPILKSQLPKILRRLFLMLGLAICTAVGTGVELLQLVMPPHTPDSTDIGLYTLGAGLGIWGACWWHRHSQGVSPRIKPLGSGVAVSSSKSSGISRMLSR